MTSPLSSAAERRAKNAENLPSIFGSVNLTNIRENVGEILKLIGRDGIFREYTLHDTNHINSMLALVDRLIPGTTADKMTTADWLVIVLSCYFHDLGMLVTKAEFENRNQCDTFVAFRDTLLSGNLGMDYDAALSADKLPPEEREEFLYQEFVRTHHAERISQWIRGEDAQKYGVAAGAVEAINGLLAGLDKVVRDDVAKVCLSHHEDDLFDLEKYRISRVYGDDPAGEANLHYAALILRTADILQIQKKRVPPVLYKLIDPSNPRSQEEWAKQAGVRAVKPIEDQATVQIHASFDKESAYFGLLAYLQQFAAKELERCYEWAKQAQQKGAKFEYPWRLIDTTQVEPRGFEGRSYSFHLDQEKILKLLTGHTLYNDSRVAIREVLQNALDAVRFRYHLNASEPMGRIDVLWDSKNRLLTVRDTGVGMTQKTIEDFLLNVGSSFYQSEEVTQRHTGFSAISRFGIGILSTFMIADEVQILTVHPDDECARRLTLPSVVKSYLIKNLPKSDEAVVAIGPHGTEVILHVRRSAELNDIEKLISYWLVLPACKVTCTIDNATPISIGFPNAADALGYYFRLEVEKWASKLTYEVRTELDDGVEIAYVVTKSGFSGVWDFARIGGRKDRERANDADSFLSFAPGMCVEGIRVRSEPAGYYRREDSPWVLVNLTGPRAPRTNVARSDVEQTPELDSACFRIYKMLGHHVQNEFERLLSKGTGIVDAASEADYIRMMGLERSPRMNYRKYREAIGGLRVIALEDHASCRAVTGHEIEAFEEIWTVDSPLAKNIEGICGILGLDLPAERIVTVLGKAIQPSLPLPRILGRSKNPIEQRDIVKIRIIPEERSHRIDVCWAQERPGRWIRVPDELIATSHGLQNRVPLWITRDPDVSTECQDYDLVSWRGWQLILATSVIGELFDLWGPCEQFGRWLCELLQFGEIREESMPLFREQLVAAMGSGADDMIARAVLPFERRFGDKSRGSRDEVYSVLSW